MSIDLLDLYFALFERSADAVSALASALKSLYQRRGFPILNEKVRPLPPNLRKLQAHLSRLAGGARSGSIPTRHWTRSPVVRLSS